MACQCVLDFVLNYAARGEVFDLDVYGEGNVTYFISIEC